MQPFESFITEVIYVLPYEYPIVCIHRYLIWDAALTYIDQAPWTGYAYNLLHHDILDTTIDAVWLVTARRYGIPTIVFLFLTNVTASLPI